MRSQKNSTFNIQHSTLSVRGFTLIELIMVIVILGMLGTTVAIRWPSGMGEEAAVRDFTRAVRFAQHTAMTREHIGFARAWGIITVGDQFTIQRADGTDPIEVPGRDDTPLGSRSYTLIDDAPLTDSSVYFNGYGEPINPADGTPLAVAVNFLVSTANIQVSICPETGYVQQGGCL